MCVPSHRSVPPRPPLRSPLPLLVLFAIGASVLRAPARPLCAAALSVDGATARAAPPSDLVLNEVLYDPPGPDTGYEFVELFNPTSGPLAVGGCVLVFVNGADPERPVTEWTGTGQATVPPGGFFVIGGPQVPGADAVADLALQNGPDALWLMRGSSALDRLAYGDLAGRGEGGPAPDPSGTSLGRVPDGSDSGDNAHDFAALPQPSPGRGNAAAHAFVALGARTDPPWRPSAGELRVRTQWLARGYESAQQGELRWELDGALLRTQDLQAARADTVAAEIVMWLSEGTHALCALAVPASPGPADTLRVPLRVGPGPVALSEIMPRPQQGEPEWIELIGRDDDVDLSGWSIADATRTPHAIAGAPRLRAGEFLLLSADPQRLRERRALPPAVTCTGVAEGWPSLNNTAGAGADVIDEILLLDRAGAAVDYLAYDARLLREAGRSIERGLFDGDSPAPWFPAPGNPTPGRANLSAAVAPPRAGLLVTPNPFTPDADGDGDVLHVLLHVQQPAGPLAAEVLDLGGERVLALGQDDGGGTLRQWLWDGRDAAGRPAPVGAYVVVVRAGATPAAPGATWRALTVLGRRR